MKLRHPDFALASLLIILSSAIRVFATDIAGPAIVTGGLNGTLDADGPIVSFGTIGTSPGVSLIFSDSFATSGTTGDTLTFSANRTSASWLWLHNASKSAMRLTDLHQLLLYQANGTTVGVTLTPASNQISLGTATLTGSGSTLTAGGAMTITGTLTAQSSIINNGTLTGGSSGLSLAAGGTNQNITLTPSGTGYTILNGKVGIGIPVPVYTLDVNGSFRALSYAGIGGSPVSNRALVTYAPSALNLAAEFTEYAGVHAIQMRPNVGGVNQITSDYWSGSTYLSLGLSGRGITSDLVLATNGNVGIGTTSPGVKLDVSDGDIRTIGPATGFIMQVPDGWSGGWANRGFSFTNSNNVVMAQFGAYGGGAPAYLGYAYIGTSYTSPWAAFSSNGNVGIGTTSPGAPLEVSKNGSHFLSLLTLSDTNTTTVGQGLVFKTAWSNSIARNWAIQFQSVAGSDFSIKQSNVQGGDPLTAGVERFYIQNGGNVGIGTTNPTQKLSVNGTIRAKEVIVDTGWADYVFDESYRLAPLSEVESHIKAKRHLPGIPSAAEVAEHGVSMGDMQAKLLSKVEELTLYLIELKKENLELRQRVGQLEAVR